MKAAVQTRYGPPEVVRVSEVDKPATKDNEVLVRVHATTVNRTDCACRAARPFFMRLFTGLVRPRSPILGNEFAGVVEAIGSRVTTFKVGDKVFGYCEGPFGAHAEYMTIPEHASLATMPANLTYQEVAPSMEGSHYALAPIRAAKVQAGQDVLVYGATGAIGSAAVQLLKSLGANVTAVCDTDHVKLVMGLGADRVIDYTAEDFTKDEQRYDVVLDAVGKSSFSQCRRLLKSRGVYVSSELGPLAQNPFLAIIGPLMRGRKVMFPIPKHDQEMVGFLRELLESGEFKPVVDRAYPLDQIVEAYRYVETGQKTGNVVINLDRPDHSHGSHPAAHSADAENVLFTQEFWEQRYQSTDSVWSGNPNTHLVSEAANLTPGTALDVGAGEGADALWLAERGWQVTAVDISTVALGRGDTHAREAGTEVAERIEWLQADLTTWDPQPMTFDLVSAQFMHLPKPQREAMVARLATSVAAGGTLLIVGHHPSDLQTTIPRPPMPELFFTAADIADTLDPNEWDVLVSEARPRSAIDPDGHTVTIHDAVLRAQRHAS